MQSFQKLVYPSLSLRPRSNTSSMSVSLVSLLSLSSSSSSSTASSFTCLFRLNAHCTRTQEIHLFSLGLAAPLHQPLWSFHAEFHTFWNAITHDSPGDNSITGIYEMTSAVASQSRAWTNQQSHSCAFYTILNYLVFTNFTGLDWLETTESCRYSMPFHDGNAGSHSPVFIGPR